MSCGYYNTEIWKRKKRGSEPVTGLTSVLENQLQHSLNELHQEEQKGIFRN